MKKLILTIAVSLATFVCSTQAQVVYGTHGATVTLNFNNLNTDFGGAFNASGGSSPFPTADPGTAPITIYSGSTNPALVVNNDDFVPGGVYSNTGSYSTATGFRALQDGSSSDFALGVKDSATRTFILRLQNTTGSALSTWSVAYNVEQYSIADSPSTIALSYSLNGTTFVTTNLSGAAAATATTNGADPDANLASVLSTARSGVISESIANNGEIWLRWSYAHDSGSSVHLGIDDVAVTAVPEPSAMLGLLAGVGWLGLSRRRG